MFGAVCSDSIVWEVGPYVTWTDDRHMNIKMGHFSPQTIHKGLNSMLGGGIWKEKDPNGLQFAGRNSAC